MPNALIDPDLLGDALIGVVDDIRRDVHSALGTRPYAVAIITRRWSGGKLGLGTSTTSVLELDPTPAVDRRGKDRKGPGGREGVDDVTLTNVSLRYTMDELDPPAGGDTEVVYRIEGNSGQGTRTEFFTINGTPIPRRGDKPGDSSDWKIGLSQVQGFAPYDGTNA